MAYRNCEVQISKHILYANFFVLEIFYFDVIYGRDWMTRHYVNNDCHAMLVKFSIPGQENFSFHGDGGSKAIPKDNETKITEISIVNLIQRRWMEYLKDFKCQIFYHPSY